MEPGEEVAMPVCRQPKRAFCTFTCGGKNKHQGDHPQYEPDGEGGEEEDSSGQLQEECIHSLPFQLEVECVVILIDF